MENQDQDLLLLESGSALQTTTTTTDNDTADSSEPEQEQNDGIEPESQAESKQETKDSICKASPMAIIEFRIEQLLNRRYLLTKMQLLMKKTEDNSDSTTEEMICEDKEELCELEAIQKELEELMTKKETLEKKGKNASSEGNEGLLDGLTYHITETPHGGIYILPPRKLTQENITSESNLTPRPAEATPSDPVTPVNSLGQMSGVTKCPCCNEVVSTETYSKVGKTMWMLCCLCSLMGCFAGCCLIPFFMDRMKSVQHRCPHCKAHIHTYQPF